MALRYSQPGQRVSAAVEFLGETTLLQSIWRIACASGLSVHVDILPPHGARHADRRALAAHMRDQLAASLQGLPR